MSPPSFGELSASHCCPGPGELLLALSAEFDGSDPAEGQTRLDDVSRGLFGIADLEPIVQAERVARTLDGELGLGVGEDYGPELVQLDRVLETGRGHPPLLAVIGRELAVRAGAPATVFVSRTRWFVGLTCGLEPVLLDATLAVDRTPDSVRGLCAHEVAYCALTGLEQRFIAGDRLFDARRARRLRDRLPVSTGRRARGTDGHDL